MKDLETIKNNFYAYRFAAFLCDVNQSRVSDEDISDFLNDKFGLIVPDLERIMDKFFEYVEG